MTKRGRIILAVVTLAVLIVIAWSIFKPRPPDPIYGGHRLSWWVLTLPFGNEPVVSPPGLDSNAVPYLIQCLKTRDSPIRKGYRTLYLRFPFWLRNRSNRPIDPWEQRDYCFMLIASLGPAARPAIPELIRLLDSGDGVEAEGALDALSMIASRDNAAVVEALTAAAQDKDPRVRDSARTALEKIDPKAAATIREKAAIDALTH
jgi:hypothetical protein